MCYDQQLDAAYAKPELARPHIEPGISAFHHTTVDKQAGAIVKVQLVAGTGDAIHTTMMSICRKIHLAAPQSASTERALLGHPNPDQQRRHASMIPRKYLYLPVSAAWRAEARILLLPRIMP